MLKQRLSSGFLLAGMVIALLLADAYLSSRPDTHPRPGGNPLRVWYSHGALTAALVLALTMLAVRELTHFARAAGFRPLRAESYVFAAGLALGPYLSANLPGTFVHDQSWGMLWLALAVGYTFSAQAVRRGTERAISNLAITFFIIFFAGGLAGFLTKIRMDIGGPEGAVLLLFSVLIVKITDTGAFFSGMLLGRHKMIPWLSPKKTWEGFVGGLVWAMGTSVGVGALLEQYGIVRFPPGFFGSPAGLLLFGGVLGLFSVAGDLCVSLLKRDAALKDSGDSIPGMGGILDILDSPLLCAPVAWFYWTQIIGVHTAAGIR